MLGTCRSCNNQVDSSASSCRWCGATNPFDLKRELDSWQFQGGCGAVFLGAIFYAFANAFWTASDGNKFLGALFAIPIIYLVPKGIKMMIDSFR